MSFAYLGNLERHMQKIKPTYEAGGGTLIYDDLKGKVFSQVRAFQIGASIFFVLVFEDKTTFQIALERQPIVRLSLYGEHSNGDLKEIAMSGKIPVPATD
jgi:hypothetical protein